MADINRNDWEKSLDAAAVRAADSDYETAKAMGAFPNNPELLEKRREEAFVKYRNELESKMPFEGATGPARTLTSWTPSRAKTCACGSAVAVRARRKRQRPWRLPSFSRSCRELLNRARTG